MSINLKNKQDIVKQYGANEKDTGSAAVQVAMMSQKISELTEHLKNNQKDFATKRGLLMMVGKRKRLLSYLKSRSPREVFLLTLDEQGEVFCIRKERKA